MSGLTPDGDSNDLAILLESSNDPLAELEGQPPGDPPPPASVSVSSVCVVQDDNTNKGAILASVDGDSAPEVSGLQARSGPASFFPKGPGRLSGLRTGSLVPVMA